MTELITLTQNPVISYKGIEQVAELVDKRIKALAIDKQVATPQTVKSLKEVRATLNKEFKTYEQQRKFVKNAISKPYQEFETKYKELIAIKFQNADNTLKDKVLSVENDLKNEKTARLKSYFDELCESKTIDFLVFENQDLNITLSASEKSLKEKINAIIEKVESDLNTIDVLSEDAKFKDEVYIEYKQHRDLNNALKVVQDRRKQAEILEQQRKEQEQAKEVVKEVEKVEPKPTPAPLQAPKVEQKIEILEATFTVKGTLEQLKGLKAYITENNIEII